MLKKTLKINGVNKTDIAASDESLANVLRKQLGLTGTKVGCGEGQCGAGRGARHLLCITLGTGVGGCLILDGALYRGARGAAGEVGHTTVERDGPRCTCGSNGCLERYVGAQYIVERPISAGGRLSILTGCSSRSTCWVSRAIFTVTNWR